MFTRQDFEREFSRGHIADIIRTSSSTNKIRRIFPENVSSYLLREQPYANISTVGAAAILESDFPRVVLTGPCLIPKKDLLTLIDYASNLFKDQITFSKYQEQLDNIISRLPTLQTVYNLGAYIDNNQPSPLLIIVIMETLEYTKLLLGNNGRLFDRYGTKVLNQLISLATLHETNIRTVHEQRGLRSTLNFIYTHHPYFSDKIKERLNEIISRSPSFRNPRYPIQSFSEGDPAGLRVEFYYTIEFVKMILRSFFGLSKYNVIMCENYRNFLPILKSYSLPITSFSIGKACNWLGLIPPPSLNGKRDMHLGVPLYLGPNSDIELQLVDIKDRFILLSYLFFISSWKEIQEPNLYKIIKSVYSDKRYLSVIKKELIDKLSSLSRNFSKEIPSNPTTIS